MTIPSSKATNTRVPKQRGLIATAWGHAYAPLWNLWYTVKIGPFGTIVAIGIFVLSAVELVGPFGHLIVEPCVPAAPGAVSAPPPIWLTPWFHYCTVVLLFGAAVMMLLHHHFLRRKTERYRNLLSSVMVLERAIVSKPTHTRDDVVSILQALVLSLERVGGKPRKRSLLNAAVVWRHDKPGEPFTIYAQDKRDKLAQVQIPEDNSAAAALIKYEREEKLSGVLLYVPSTKYPGGVAIIIVDDPNNAAYNGKVFQKTDIVKKAYQPIDGADEKLMRCMLCIRISLDQVGKPPGEPDQCAVLCLSGEKVDCLNAVEFAGTRVASSLLSHVMRNYQ